MPAQVIEVIHGDSNEEICQRLRKAIYDAGSNVHNLALWSGKHESSLAARLHGKINLRVTTLIDLQKLVNKYLQEIADDAA